MPAKTFILCLTMLAGLSSHDASATPNRSGETVVLLHGMGRTSLSMQKLGTQLAQAGFEVVNVGYPSTRLSVDDSVQHLQTAFSERQLLQKRTVHFVTHSLGGILLRAYLQQHSPSNLGRVVMVSPPNQGSELADWFMSGPLRHVYRIATGPSGQELGTRPDSTPNRLGPAHFPLGVITGDRSLNPLFSRAFPGPNDGKVSVERAQLDGMADFLVVPHSHSFIMRSSVVTRETIHFLSHGRFSKSAA